MIDSAKTPKWMTLFVCVCALSACGGNKAPEQNKNAAAAEAPSPYKPTATFQELMDAAVDGPSDYIWEAVSTTSDMKGVHERQPRTDEEWHQFRRQAMLLVEAANLIAVPGRRVSNGDKTIENKEPLPAAEIQQRLDANHDALLGFASALRDTSLKLVAAADKKDVEAITNIGGELDEVCEACHKVFWYPDQNQYGSASSTSSAK